MLLLLLLLGSTTTTSSSSSTTSAVGAIRRGRRDATIFVLQTGALAGPNRSLSAARLETLCKAIVSANGCLSGRLANQSAGKLALQAGPFHVVVVAAAAAAASCWPLPAD